MTKTSNDIAVKKLLERIKEDSERNFLYETCLSWQDDMIAILNYYGIVKTRD